MANELRGEIDIEICGTTYTLRPSFRFLAELESKTGRGAYAIMGSLSDPDTMRMSDIASIIFCGLKTSKAKCSLTYDEVGEYVMEHALKNSELLKSVIRFMVLAATGRSVGEEDESQDPKPPTA